MPISGKDIAKLFKKSGFELVKSAGKGSHIKMKKGKCTVTIPGHKELSSTLQIFGLAFR